jgi:hypothetical protein
MFAARNMTFCRSSGVTYDTDAAAYFAAIASAGSSISDANKSAVDTFVVGCKADGIWPAIKVSCILAAADDLTGALVPLVGSAPTNTNFVSGDYSRTLGLTGNGSTKCLDSNRAGNADPQDNHHAAAYVTTAPTGSTAIFGSGTTAAGVTNAFRSGASLNTRSQNSTALSTTASLLGLCGVSRTVAGEYVVRANGASTTKTQASQTPASQNMFIFSRSAISLITDARISFYSIGEGLDQSLLDARLVTLMAALT